MLGPKFGNYFRVGIGVVLIPCAIALTRTVMASIGASAALSWTSGAWPFFMVMAGVAAAALAIRVLPASVRLYVLGHELTHAMWGVLLGARVSGMRVSRRGGYVKLSESNWLTALAPYFFAFYTFLVILAYYLLLLFVDLRPYTLVWLALVGFTLGFHFIFTIHALTRGQQDLRIYGRLFSFVVIYIMNMLGICLILLLASPLTLQDLVRRVAVDQVCIWSYGARALASVF